MAQRYAVLQEPLYAIAQSGHARWGYCFAPTAKTLRSSRFPAVPTMIPSVSA
jgi:hypothetical protein